MKNHKKKAKAYGFSGNLRFMLREQRMFQKTAVWVPFANIPAELAVAALGIWLPKIVLEAISNHVPPYGFLLQVGSLTAALAGFKFLGYYTEQSILKNAVALWNTYFYVKKEWKIVDMDYAAFSSPEGKLKIEKAHRALSNNSYLEPLFKLIDLPLQAHRGREVPKDGVTGWEIEFHHVSFRYPSSEQYALKDL